MTEAVIRVLLADDHPMYRAGLRFALSAEPDVEVVAEAGDGQQAIDLAEDLRPDVVVMDLHLPTVLGVDATRAIIRERPETGVLVLTMFDDDASVFAAMRAGARGYLLKGADPEDIIRGIRTVAAGDVLVGASVAQHVRRYFAAPPAAESLPGLTGRERDVLDLVARGLTNPQIATSLGISGKTVRNHVSALFAKLHVADRAAAIRRARSAGIGADPPTPPPR